MLTRWLIHLAHDEKGATAIEYGLIASLVVIAILGALHNLADATISMWSNVASEVIGATS